MTDNSDITRADANDPINNPTLHPWGVELWNLIGRHPAVNPHLFSRRNRIANAVIPQINQLIEQQAEYEQFVVDKQRRENEARLELESEGHCVCCGCSIPVTAKTRLCGECFHVSVVDQDSPELMCKVHRNVIDPTEVSS